MPKKLSAKQLHEILKARDEEVSILRRTLDQLRSSQEEWRKRSNDHSAQGDKLIERHRHELEQKNDRIREQHTTLHLLQREIAELRTALLEAARELEKRPVPEFDKVRDDLRRKRDRVQAQAPRNPGVPSEGRHCETCLCESYRVHLLKVAEVQSASAGGCSFCSRHTYEHGERPHLVHEVSRTFEGGVIVRFCDACWAELKHAL